MISGYAEYLHKFLKFSSEKTQKQSSFFSYNKCNRITAWQCKDSMQNDLPEEGITGNDHFLFQDLNHDVIADHVENWIQANAAK